MIALYAAALDARVRSVALRQAVTDYRSLSVAERYTQPFGIYAYGLLREFDLPDVARSLGSRPILLMNPVPASAGAQNLYSSARNVTVRTLEAADDPVTSLVSWLSGH